MQSRVTCNSLCNVKVNIMGGRPLVAGGLKATDRICDSSDCVVMMQWETPLGGADCLNLYRHMPNLKLVAYSDADWAADLNDRRSVTGYCFSLSESGPVISWKSKKQQTVALSTCEAEYMALSATAQESLYLVNLINGMDNVLEYAPVTVFEDNQGAIALSKNPVCRQRCKHIDIRYHFVQSVFSDGKITLHYCPTVDMVADILTKSVSRIRMDKFVCFLFGM